MQALSKTMNNTVLLHIDFLRQCSKSCISTKYYPHIATVSTNRGQHETVYINLARCYFLGNTAPRRYVSFLFVLFFVMRLYIKVSIMAIIPQRDVTSTPS